MKRLCTFNIDDVIWVFRDLTRERPASMFDNPFLAMLKEAHDKYGTKTQMNVFYRTDFFYGEDEFTLADMTDAYKKEWEEASDWLKMGFHAKQEWPDYPYINADYDTVKINLERTKNEVFRFAGEKSFTWGCVPHWMPMSKEGVQALRDGGIRLMACSRGDIEEELTETDALCPNCEALRVQYNRKPETKIYRKSSVHHPDHTVVSICGYNHLTEEQAAKYRYTTGAYLDEETGMYLRGISNAPCLNACNEEFLVEGIKALVGKEFIGHGTHEQYFYPDYFKWHPDYKDKVLAAARVLYENGYKYIFMEDLIDA